MLHFFPMASQVGMATEVIVLDLLKLCIIYYLGLKSPVIVFLTISHDSLDKDYAIKCVDHHKVHGPLQATQMEEGMWQWFKIFIRYMLCIMQHYKDHF
ncbi:hypothetical protein EXN66_Car013482 [Channa argus]|uniref:Uncharacterized protein n=1 Tax=Channa argus TaxID=215402 RepID=A0A6G1Q5A2_CHAAH|nr:hypothetical protein EXN66_Car013482 [Channa argus]